MRSFAKDTPPADFRARADEWRRDCEHDPTLLTNTAEARSRFDLLDKRSARTALLAEQTGLCAFCLGRIRRESPTDGPSGTVLAHLVPVRVDTRLVLDWDNLVGSCKGGSGTARHCDNLQGDRELYIHPPHIPALELHIRYSSRGELCYQGPSLCGRTREQIQAEFNDVLGLNIERLKANRKAVLEVAHQKMESLGWTRAHLEKETRRWSTPAPDGYTPYFCVAVAYLQRKLAASS